MTNLVNYINELIAKDELWRFYKSKPWRELKQKILIEFHYECYECKRRGIITRFDYSETGKKALISTVHHVNHVRTHPALALSEYYYDNGVRKRNLIPVCKACHNKLHPEKNKNRDKSESKSYTNEERW